MTWPFYIRLRLDWATLANVSYTHSWICFSDIMRTIFILELKDSAWNRAMSFCSIPRIVGVRAFSKHWPWCSNDIPCQYSSHFVCSVIWVFVSEFVRTMRSQGNIRGWYLLKACWHWDKLCTLPRHQGELINGYQASYIMRMNLYVIIAWWMNTIPRRCWKERVGWVELWVIWECFLCFADTFGKIRPV